MNAKITAKQTISAVVIRADGTREDLGIISTSEVPLTQKILQKLRGKK